VSCLVLVFVRGGRRGGRIGGAFFTPRPTNRTPQERRLLLFGGNGRCRRRRGRALTFGRRRRLGLRLRTGIYARCTTICAIAVLAITIAAVGTLIALAATEAVITLRTIRVIAVRTPIVAIAIVAGTIALVAVTAEILTIATVAVEALSVAVRPIVVTLAVMPRLPVVLTIVVAILMVEVARLLLERLLLRTFALRRLPLDVELVAFLIPELIAITVSGTGKSVGAGCAVVAERIDAALLRHLLAIAEDDAVVVLGVLKIVFRQDRIA